MGKTKTLKLDQLRIDGGTQIRVSLSEDTVKEYAEAYQEGVELPPVKAVFDGSEYWLWEGFHRWHASRRAGLGEIQAEVSQGTQRDAILLACGANASHGLKRTNADKRKAVETLLADEEWGKWSDAKIADEAAVTRQFVASVRSQGATIAPSTEKRVGRDGKEYPAKQRKKKAETPVPKSPKEQLAEFFGKPEGEPAKEDSETIEYGSCPHCKGTKWTETEDGVNCSKCNHPHGEPVGDVSEDRVKTLKSKTGKTAEALLRCFDDQWEMGCISTEDYNEGVAISKRAVVLGKGGSR